MRTEYKHNPPIPYSLHDMRVKKIIIQDKTIVLVEGDTGRLTFQGTRYLSFERI